MYLKGILNKLSLIKTVEVYFIPKDEYYQGNIKMDALILAGGENKRITVIKGFLEINSRRIIESNVESLKKVFKKVIISTNNPELYFYIGVPMIGDVVEQRGPMTGILSALVMPDLSDIFVTACDMPFINVILIKYLKDRWEDKWDAVIPVFRKKPQPLFGIYSKRIARNIEESINSGKRGLTEFLQTIEVLYIDEDEFRNIDAEGRSFVNINTMDDFKREGGKTCLV